MRQRRSVPTRSDQEFDGRWPKPASLATTLPWRPCVLELIRKEHGSGLAGAACRPAGRRDVIAAAKCKPVHHLSDLIDQLEQVGIGHKIKLTVTRNDQSRTVEADVVDSGHNGRRSERQDAGAGPFVVPVVPAFMRRRRGVAVIVPPLVRWGWALGPWSSHAGIPDSIGGVIGALRDVLGLQRVVLELRNRPDARLAA